MIMYKYGNHDATVKKRLLKISHGFMADTTVFGRESQLMLTVKPVVARSLTSMNVLPGKKIVTSFHKMGSLNVYRFYP